MSTFHFPVIIFLFSTFSCNDQTRLNYNDSDQNIANVPLSTIKSIPLPEGYNYFKSKDSDYAEWLLDLKLRESKTVHLYNGKLKDNQNVQFAVLDISIGNKDLLQCADAAIKLRADYLFSKKRFAEIKFTATSGDELSFEKYLHGTRWQAKNYRLQAFQSAAKNMTTDAAYNQFLELVYSYCGTYSLSKQLKAKPNVSEISPGNIFLYGGFPGHAVTVMAVAANSSGEKVFLLSQGYMPAQDIHILKNYENSKLSPWYSATEIFPLYTPQWKFDKGSLKQW